MKLGAPIKNKILLVSALACFTGFFAVLGWSIVKLFMSF